MLNRGYTIADRLKRKSLTFWSYFSIVSRGDSPSTNYDSSINENITKTVV